MISAAVCISDDATGNLEALLVRLLHKTPNKKVSAVIDGTVFVSKRKLKLQHAARLDTTIAKCHLNIWVHSSVCDQSPESIPSTQAANSVPGTSMNDSHLYCPKCTYAVHMGHKAFHTGNLDTTVTCGRCRKATPAYRFRCTCMHRWYQCDDHKRMPGCLRDINPGLKRKLLMCSSQRSKIQRLALAESTPSSENQLEAVREINPRFLSSGLKRKFSHLLPSDG